LMAILASMTRVFNAPFVLRAEEPQTAFDVASLIAYTFKQTGLELCSRW
jgi:hypothetical protein